MAAIRASQLGLRTAVVERDRIGGRCLNYACIPAKAVLRSADVLEDVRHAGDFGVLTSEAAVDFSAVASRRDAVISTLTHGVADLMKRNGVELIEGDATLTDVRSVRVSTDSDELELTGRVTILACGSVRSPIPGVEFSKHVIGTEEAWALKELPKSIAVVGAGASGMELASAFARLGTKVELIEATDRVLPTEDAEISRIAERSLKKQGVAVRTGTFVINVREQGEKVVFECGEQSSEAEWLVVAVGRKPDVRGLGLDVADLLIDDSGLLRVDDHLRTSRAGVWAIGDLVAGPSLAHKASDEAIVAVEDAAGNAVRGVAYDSIPRITFSMPNVASLGLTEEQAKVHGFDVVVGKVNYGAVGAGSIYGDRSGLVKIVGDRTYGEILGAHIIGAKSSELIQELVFTRTLEGGFPEVARSIHGHPTFSEAVMEAARAADGWLIHG